MGVDGGIVLQEDIVVVALLGSRVCCLLGGCTENARKCVLLLIQRGVGDTEVVLQARHSMIDDFNAAQGSLNSRTVVVHLLRGQLQMKKSMSKRKYHFCSSNRSLLP